MRDPPPTAALKLTVKVACLAVIEDSGSSTVICQHMQSVHDASTSRSHIARVEARLTCIPCRPNEVIDATVKGGHARFINHSCEPNCATEKWLVDGDLRVGIYARAHIPAGAEITYHYQLVWNQGHKVK